MFGKRGKMAPLDVCVAAARMHDGRVELDNECPEIVQLMVGQELRVQVRYAYEESSQRREEFHVRLRSRLANQGPMEVRRDIADHRILSDAEWGIVEQPFQGLAAGRHDLVVDVCAEYGVRAWRGKGEQRLQQVEFAMTLPVTVAAG